MKVAGDAVDINPCNHIVKIDGITIAKLVTDERGNVCLQFIDKNRWRAAKRGSMFAEIEIGCLAETLAQYNTSRLVVIK